MYAYTLDILGLIPFYLLIDDTLFVTVHAIGGGREIAFVRLSLLLNGVIAQTGSD